MGGGFTPRFAFEVVFLVLLAIACGLADLRPLVIGLVMGGAWVLMTGWPIAPTFTKYFFPGSTLNLEYVPPRTMLSLMKATGTCVWPKKQTPVF